MKCSCICFKNRNLWTIYKLRNVYKTCFSLNWIMKIKFTKFKSGTEKGLLLPWFEMLDQFVICHPSSVSQHKLADRLFWKLCWTASHLRTKIVNSTFKYLLKKCFCSLSRHTQKKVIFHWKCLVLRRHKFDSNEITCVLNCLCWTLIKRKTEEKVEKRKWQLRCNEWRRFLLFHISNSRRPSGLMEASRE